MLMLLRLTSDDSWIEPCAEAQPLASKGRREAGVVFLACVHDVSSARVNVVNPRVFTEPLAPCREASFSTNTGFEIYIRTNSSSIKKPARSPLHRCWLGAGDGPELLTAGAGVRKD